MLVMLVEIQNNGFQFSKTTLSKALMLHGVGLTEKTFDHDGGSKLISFLFQNSTSFLSRSI
jgi:hypothetical protein